MVPAEIWHKNAAVASRIFAGAFPACLIKVAVTSCAGVVPAASAGASAARESGVPESIMFSVRRVSRLTFSIARARSAVVAAWCSYHWRAVSRVARLLVLLRCLASAGRSGVWHTS